jgi:hypothetical protein
MSLSEWSMNCVVIACMDIYICALVGCTVPTSWPLGFSWLIETGWSILVGVSDTITISFQSGSRPYRLRCTGLLLAPSTGDVLTECKPRIDGINPPLILLVKRMGLAPCDNMTGVV